MKHVGKSGAALAIAALGLALGGASLIPVAQAAGDDQILCAGVNSCKGQGDCHSYVNACKGQNDCKGKGYKYVTSTQCASMKGKVVGGDAS
jgi:hypothetical protein